MIDFMYGCMHIVCLNFSEKALDYRTAATTLPVEKPDVLYNSHSMSLINHVLYNLNSLNINYINSAIVRKCGIFDRIRGVIVYLIEVFLIAMIYILYVVSLVASRLHVILLRI